MNYLYHDVPEDMKGSFLLPQNLLKIKYPDLYKQAIKKYKGRRILDRKIPIIDCLWSEVVFLSAVHPDKIGKALRKSGWEGGGKKKFYRIDPRCLDPDRTVIFLDKYDDVEDSWKKDNFTAWNIKNIKKYNKIPNKTIKYYKSELKEGNDPLVYPFIPHIIYKGKIKVNELEVLEVNW